MDLGQLGAVAAARQFRERESTAKAIVESCLAQIAAREPTVGAWAHIDPAAARAAAAAADQRAGSGPLAGVPIGIKDVIDTVDMPTTYGSPIYAGHRPDRDAACVARLREAGAILLGKTVSTEFAYFTPGKTANPHNAGHTPGGSSSGSAAAVADGMVPLALGTQTAGSVIRPAAFCGVIGFKGSYGWTSMAGVKPFAASLDTLGLFGRDLDDVELLRSVLAGEQYRVLPTDGPAPRIGFCRTAAWSTAEPAMRKALETTAALLAAAGASVADAVLPVDGAELVAAQMTIMSAEAGVAYAADYRDHRDGLSAALRTLIEEGQAMAAASLAAAHALADRAREGMTSLFGQFDVLLTPPAPGEAPAGLDRTGDPIFNRAWTLLGLPCVTLPIGRGQKGLPLGLQLIGPRAGDRRLMETAAWVGARVGRQIPVCIL